MEKTLFFSGLGDFEISNGKFYVVNDDVLGYECMQEVNYETFMEALKEAKPRYYNSWAKEKAEEYDEFYEYALTFKN